MKALIAIVASILFLTACQRGMGGNAPILTKSDIGTVTGAAAGAWVGSNIGGGAGRTVAIATGTLLGAALGRSVGESLDRADLNYYHRASQTALERGQPGQSFPWQNPQSGVSGSVTPSGYFQNQSGNYCREYTQSINIGGRMQEGHGVACRQPDGTWRIQG